MKKGKIFIVTLASIVGIGLAIGTGSSLLSSNASNQDLNTLTQVQNTSDYTGLLNKDVEAKLNANGLTDETLQTLDTNQIKTLATCKNADDLRITTNYYSYNEEDLSIKEISKEEFIASSKDTNPAEELTCASSDSTMEETGAKSSHQTTGDIGTKTFAASLAIWPKDKNKNMYNVQAYYKWNSLPKNRGYDLIGLEFDSDISLYRNTYSTKELTYYRAYKKYKDPNKATYQYKDLKTTTWSTYNNFHKKTKVQYSPSKGLTIRTRKFPSNYVNSPFNGLDAASKKVFNREKANVVFLTGVTYVLDATIIAPRNYFEVSAVYGHQIKKTETCFDIKGVLEISSTPSLTISGKKSYSYSTIYQDLPSQPVTLAYEK